MLVPCVISFHTSYMFYLLNTNQINFLLLKYSLVKNPVICYFIHVLCSKLISDFLIFKKTDHVFSHSLVYRFFLHIKPAGFCMFLCSNVQSQRDFYFNCVSVTGKQLLFEFHYEMSYFIRTTNRIQNKISISAFSYKLRLTKLHHTLFQRYSVLCKLSSVFQLLNSNLDSLILQVLL